MTVLDNIDHICNTAPELKERQMPLYEESEIFNAINTGKLYFNIFILFCNILKY